MFWLLCHSFDTYIENHEVHEIMGKDWSWRRGVGDEIVTGASADLR